MDYVVRIISLCLVVVMVNSLPTPEENPIDIAKICAQNCTVTENLCYAPLATECGMFILCKLDRIKKWTGDIMHCAHGLFFDKTERRCLRPEKVNCEQDRCKTEKELTVYKTTLDNCRQYWSCQNDNTVGRYSKPECCPENSTFVDGKCDDTIHCNGTCGSDKKNNTECKLTAVKGKPTMFKNGDGPTAKEQNCPSSMVFDQGSCACKLSETFTRPACEIDIDVGYAENGFVNNNPRNWVGSYVLVSKQTIDGITYFGNFTGTQYIEIPLYDGLVLKLIAGRILFYPIADGRAKKQNRTLLSNCMPSVGKKSFEIELGPSDILTIKGHTIANNARNKFALDIKYKKNAWNNLDFIFSDGNLKAQMTVNNEQIDLQEIPSTRGAIEEIGPFKIGKCSTDIDGFYGYIKEIKTYKCDPGTLFTQTAPAP